MRYAYRLRGCLLAATLGCLCQKIALAQDSSVKISGSAGLRIKSEGTRNGRVNQEAALKVETKRTDSGLKAVTKVEADSSDLLVRIDDGYFDLKLSEHTKIRGGLMKKEIGLESSQSKKERTAPFKSRVLSQLENWGYSGSYNQIKVSQDFTTGSYAVAIGSSNSHDTFLTGGVQTAVPGLSDWLEAGIWMLYQADRIDNGYQKSGILTAALRTTFDTVNWELEAGEGTNPHESEFQQSFGNGKQVRFNYLRILSSVNIEFASHTVQPFIQYDFFRRDHTQPYDNSLSYTGGVNWFYDESLRFSAAVQSEGAAYGPDQKKRHWSVQQSLLQAVYYFN